MSSHRPVENADFPPPDGITAETVRSHQKMLHTAGPLALEALKRMFPELISGQTYATQSDMPSQGTPDQYIPPHLQQAEQLQQAY